MTYSERRNTTKNTAYAVTPNTHGVTTAYAVYLVKALYSLGYTYGVKYGVTINLSNTPVTAIHSMA